MTDGFSLDELLRADAPWPRPVPEPKPKPDSMTLRLLRIVSGSTAQIIQPQFQLTSDTGRGFRWLRAAVGGELSAARRSDTVVSVVFAHPDTIVLRDLTARFIDIDIRSGEAWHLHFAGYHHDPVEGLVFDRAAFRGFQRALGRELARLRPDRALPQGHAWRYSGTADIVSFMARAGDDGDADFDLESICALQLTDAGGGYRSIGLPELTELISDWEDDDPRARAYLPGEPLGTMSVRELAVPLRWTLAAMVAGVVGNRADDLLLKLLSR